MKSRQYHWNYLWLLLFAVGMGFFLIGAPKQVDDYRFMAFFKYWFDAQDIKFPENGGNILTHGLPLQGFADMMHEGWLSDNIRLSNFLASILLCFPKWVGSGLMLLLFMLSVLTGFRLAGVDTSRSPLVPAALTMFAFMLPWYDSFGSLVFQTNYILPTWLGLTLLWRLRPDALTTLPDTTLNLLLAITLGIAHEGIAIAFACGLAALACLKRPWHRRDIFAAILLTLAGTILIFCAPGEELRYHYIVRHLSEHPGFLSNIQWLDFLIYEIPAYSIFIILTAICLLRKRTRTSLSNPVFIFTTVSSTIAITIKVFCIAQPRMLLWPETLCIFGILHLLLILSDKKLNRYNLSGAIVAGLLLTLLFTDISLSGHNTIRCRRTMAQLLEHKLAYPDDCYFGDTCMTEDMSAIGCSRPGNSFATIAMLNVNEYYFGIHDLEQGRLWHIYPRELKNVTSGSGTDISGGQGIRRVGNHFFMPYDADFDTAHSTGTSWEPVKATGYIDFGDGPEPWTIRFFKFRSKGDGKHYYRLSFPRNWYTTHFKPILSITLAK